MSRQDGCLWEVVAYKSLHIDHMVQNFSSLPRMFLVPARNMIMLQCLVIQFSLYYSICQMVTCRRLKTKETFQLLALKVVTVAYEKWLFTRDSKHSDLTLENCRLDFRRSLVSDPPSPRRTAGRVSSKACL